MERKVRAKEDLHVLMEDNRFYNFIAGHEYRSRPRGEYIVLIDENKCGYICETPEEFSQYFEYIEEPKTRDLNLDEAIRSVMAGNFVTNQHFSSDQSMHWYKGNLYYEDGAVVTSDFLKEQEFAKEGWRIIATKSRINKEKLKEMHDKSKGYMLNKGSYMDCIIN